MEYKPYKSTWMNPNIEYLFDNDIIEFDIRDAGFSIIKQFRLLPDEKIREVSLLNKGLERHIAIGKLQRYDKVFSNRLSDKFAEVRSIFLSTNNITSDRIISVKKDAIYTIGHCSRLKFGNIEFIAKNHYTSYIRFPDVNNLEIYYNSSNMDIKGMGDSEINRHRLYMYEFIRSVLQMIEDNNPQVKRFIIRFINDYKSQNLDEEYYLEFNNKSRELNPLFNYKNIIIPLIQVLMKELN